MILSDNSEHVFALSVNMCVCIAQWSETAVSSRLSQEGSNLLGDLRTLWGSLGVLWTLWFKDPLKSCKASVLNQIEMDSVFL